MLKMIRYQGFTGRKGGGVYRTDRKEEYSGMSFFLSSDTVSSLYPISVPSLGV